MPMKRFLLFAALIGGLMTLNPTGGRAQTTVLSEDFASITEGDNTTTGGSSKGWGTKTDNMENENFPYAGRSSVYQAGA